SVIGFEMPNHQPRGDDPGKRERQTGDAQPDPPLRCELAEPAAAGERRRALFRPRNNVGAPGPATALPGRRGRLPPRRPRSAASRAPATPRAAAAAPPPARGLCPPPSVSTLGRLLVSLTLSPPRALGPGTGPVRRPPRIFRGPRVGLRLEPRQDSRLPNERRW